MRKRIKKTVMLVLCAAFLFSLLPAAYAASDEAYSERTEGRSSNYQGEYYQARTPSSEPGVLYVSGKTAVSTKMFLISIGSSACVIRVFVRPDSSGEFNVRIVTTEGNHDYPTATKGTVVTTELGGELNRMCYDTCPGYLSVGSFADGLYRIRITRAMTDEQVNGVYDNSWYLSTNPLSGERGLVSKEIVISMSSNIPKVVYFDGIAARRTSVSAKDASLSSGTEAYARYTDCYLTDIENLIRDGGVLSPMRAEEVAYIKAVADEVTAGASTNYEKLARIYTYVAGNFYYDYYAFENNVNKQYCNPYENLYKLRSSVSSPNSINGKVATVCNGYSAMVIALARAEGIPARMVSGCQIDDLSRTWRDMSTYPPSAHYWAEVYVNGTWLAVDANRGSLNKWRRSNWDVADDSTWRTGDFIIYSGLDMSDYEIACNYCYNSIPCSYEGKLYPPFHVAADSSTGYVVLTWDPVEGAEGYYIYRGKTESTIAYYASSGSATTYTSSTEELDTEYLYRVRAWRTVDGVCEEGGYSNMVAATVTTEALPPSIVTQPENANVQLNSTATFTVTASGATSYQWQYYSASDNAWYDLTNAAYVGAKTNSMSVQATAARNGYLFRCAVRNLVGTVYTNSVKLTVQSSKPTITAQPTSVTKAAGETATFTVTASGASSYQWQYYSSSYGAWYDLTNAAYVGAKTNSMSVQATTARNGYLFRCAVTNAAGTVYTNSVKLTVQSAKPTITAQPTSVTKAAGETATFTVTASGATSYQWQYYSSSDSAWYNLTNAAYAGAKTNSMSVQATTARNGYLFRCAVTNAAGTVYTNSVKLTVQSAKPTITAQPSSVTKAAGETATFKVTASGATSYQWQYYSSSYGAWYDLTNAAYAGAKTATMSVQATTARNGYLFRCAVKNAAGTVYTNSVKLTVQSSKPTITSQPTSVTKAAGETATFTVTASGATSYQWQYYSSSYGAWYDLTNAAYAGAKTNSMSVQATTARNGYLFRCAVTNAGGTVYTNSVKLTVQSSKPTITSQPSNVTKAAGETATFTVTATGATSYQWQYYSSSDSAWYDLTNAAYAGAKTNSMSVQATAARNGYLFRCAVKNAGGTVYTNSVTLTVQTAKPTITSQPSSVTKAAGETATFTVTASGATSYQWQYYSSSYGAWYDLTNAAYAGAKTNSMSVQATAARNGYLFRCAVKNAGGTVYTNSVKLTVQTAKPTITVQPTNVTKAAGETATFTVTASGATSYQWQYYSTSDSAWYDLTNSAYAGVKTNSMSVQATAARNGFIFRCAITNAGGTVYTDSVKLTVSG